MSLLEHYRESYEHEKNADQKMLAMIESVPEAGRGDARFQQAVSIAAHLAACREHWLGHMDGESARRAAQQGEAHDFAALGPRLAALQARWTDYLARLDEGGLAREFEFSENGQSFSVPTEVQIVQLFGHASYHRGQVTVLVGQLGGEVSDTDYVDWWWANRKESR